MSNPSETPSNEATYGFMDMMTQESEESDVSPRSRAAALALCIGVGVFGGHRFYVGKFVTGALQLCTFAGLGLWWLYDVILISAGGFRDAEGRRVARWAETDGMPSLKGLDEEKILLLLDELDAQRGEIGDLQERVDFLERMLSQVRDREALPRL